MNESLWDDAVKTNASSKLYTTFVVVFVEFLGTKTPNKPRIN